jgi:hypothetical protein
MPTNIRALRRARHRQGGITDEMLDLFATGREIIAHGDDARWEEEGGRRAEFLRIAKKLDWSLLKREPHQVSVFDDLAGDAPAYMQERNSASFPDFNGWCSGQELQRRLLDALAARKRVH